MLGRILRALQCARSCPPVATAAAMGRARLAAGPWAMGSADVRASGYVIFLCRASRRVAPRSDVPPATPRSYAKPARTRPSCCSGDRVGGHPLLDSTKRIPGTCGCPRNLDVRTSRAAASLSESANARASRAASRACRPARGRAASTTCGSGPTRSRASSSSRSPEGVSGTENVRRADTPGRAMRRMRRSCGSSPRLRNSISAGPAGDALARQHQAVLVGGDEQAGRRPFAARTGDLGRHQGPPRSRRAP